jgi:basic amino acid/polyamine antiporter, APA family
VWSPTATLYSDLLDYVVFSVLIFYVLTIAGIFVLRAKRPAPSARTAPLRTRLPLLYIVTAAAIHVVLLLYRTQTAWPGLVIVLLGVPVYLVWSKRAAPRTASP